MVSDVLQVIHLIPDLLPDGSKAPSGLPDLTANDKKRALLAMGNYLSAVGISYICFIKSLLQKRADYAKKMDLKLTETPEETQHLLRTLIIIDTTLLNCYLQVKMLHFPHLLLF